MLTRQQSPRDLTPYDDRINGIVIGVPAQARKVKPQRMERDERTSSIQPLDSYSLHRAREGPLNVPLFRVFFGGGFPPTPQMKLRMRIEIGPTTAIVNRQTKFSEEVYDKESKQSEAAA
jgi:hypothetical protein